MARSLNSGSSCYPVIGSTQLFTRKGKFPIHSNSNDICGTKLIMWLKMVDSVYESEGNIVEKEKMRVASNFSVFPTMFSESFFIWRHWTSSLFDNGLYARQVMTRMIRENNEPYLADML